MVPKSEVIVMPLVLYALISVFLHRVNYIAIKTCISDVPFSNLTRVADYSGRDFIVSFTVRSK
jgi:hypothetical protein